MLLELNEVMRALEEIQHDLHEIIYPGDECARPELVPLSAKLADFSISLHSKLLEGLAGTPNDAHRLIEDIRVAVRNAFNAREPVNGSWDEQRKAAHQAILAFRDKFELAAPPQPGTDVSRTLKPLACCIHEVVLTAVCPECCKENRGRIQPGTETRVAELIKLADEMHEHDIRYCTDNHDTDCMCGAVTEFYEAKLRALAGAGGEGR
jgi:hypothetical protein